MMVILLAKQTQPVDVDSLPQNHYVDNKKFYEACLEHWNKCKEAEAANNPRPKISDYIGQCIMDISNKLATSRKFANYVFRDEMVEDAVENCILYFHNFNPEKFKHPFNYFTTIAYYAFIRRIAKEKKQMYIRQKAMFNMVDDGLAEYLDGEQNGSDLNIDEKLINNEFMNDFVTNYENKLGLNKAKGKKKSSTDEEPQEEQENLNTFFDDEQENRWEDL